jgi:fucose permease
VLAVGAYLGIGLFSLPALSVISCALCGLAVGMMWPGTFSKAAGMMRRGGTAMFALLALGGDLGCSLGPSVVGVVSGMLNDELRLGILAAVVFPIVLLVGIWRCRRI